MKITGFNPIIITKNQDAIVKMFEELGFEKSHQPQGTAASGFDFTVVRMKDANGFHVDVALSAGPIPQDITAIRINVDDFSEAYDYLTERGFKTMNGKPATETDSSKGIFLISPSGFCVVLVQHIK